MRHHRTALSLAGYTIQQVEFGPATFQPEDLLQLPYRTSLSGWGRKRQAEHLVGRIAVVYALREVGEKQPSAISDQRQPLWSAPWFGSISHCGQRALAVIADRLASIDIERRSTPQMAAGPEGNIINPVEKTALLCSGLPFPLVLTLASSAKGSRFKVTPVANQCVLGFADLQVVDIMTSTLALEFAE